MRAYHKYKNSNHPEAKRRLAQSLGYKISIWDMPHMIALLKRAGIDLEDTQGVLDYDYDAVKETIKI